MHRQALFQLRGIAVSRVATDPYGPPGKLGFLLVSLFVFSFF
jgi:hypothetical protein